MKKLVITFFALLSSSVVWTTSKSFNEIETIISNYNNEDLDFFTEINIWDDSEEDSDTSEVLKEEFPNGIEEFLDSFAYRNRFTRTTLYVTNILTPEEQAFANWGNSLEKEDRELLLKLLDKNIFFSSLQEAKDALEKAKSNL